MSDRIKRRGALWAAAGVVLTLLLTWEGVPVKRDEEIEQALARHRAGVPRPVSPEQQESDERAAARHRAYQEECARLGPAPKKPNLRVNNNLLPELDERKPDGAKQDPPLPPTPGAPGDAPGPRD
jgi:hypothetical protein